MFLHICSILCVYVSRVAMPDAKDSRKERRDLQVCMCVCLCVCACLIYGYMLDIWVHVGCMGAYVWHMFL